MSSGRRVTEAGGTRSMVAGVLGVTSVVTRVAGSVSRRRGSVASTAGGRSSVLLLELLLLVLLGARNHRGDLVGGRGLTSAGRGGVVRACFPWGGSDQPDGAGDSKKQKSDNAPCTPPVVVDGVPP